MGRVLAIDYGKKRVGVAVTDPSQIIASPLETVLSHEIFDYLKKYMENEQVDCIVVGYPRQMNNEPSESIRYINPFLRGLERKFPEMKIELFDERFTSKIAFRAMIDGGVKKQKRRDKAMVDRISASLILQSFLEHRSNTSPLF